MKDTNYRVKYQWTNGSCRIVSETKVSATTPHHAHFKAGARIRKLLVDAGCSGYGITILSVHSA